MTVTKATRSYTFISRAAATGINYIGGFYNAPASATTLNQASNSFTYGTANVSYAAHFFIVASGAGTTNGSNLQMTVTGTSVSDDGSINVSDSEVILLNGTTSVTNQYYETVKKWLGQVTVTLSSLSATTYSYTFNYGFAKYDDLGNKDFTIEDFEVTGLANTNDSDIDVQLLKHSDTGWIYSNSSFIPGSVIICSLKNDHTPNNHIVAGSQFAYKRTDISQFIEGADSEGFMVRVVTSVNNAITYLNAHVGYTF